MYNLMSFATLFLKLFSPLFVSVLMLLCKTWKLTANKLMQLFPTPCENIKKTARIRQHADTHSRQDTDIEIYGYTVDSR